MKSLCLALGNKIQNNKKEGTTLPLPAEEGVQTWFVSVEWFGMDLSDTDFECDFEGVPISNLQILIDKSTVANQNWTFFCKKWSFEFLVLLFESKNVRKRICVSLVGFWTRRRCRLEH
jgi:hypothetical protein